MATGPEPKKRCPDCEQCGLCSETRCRICRSCVHQGPCELGPAFTHGEYLAWKKKVGANRAMGSRCPTPGAGT